MAFVLDVLAEGRPAAMDEAAVGRAVRETFGLTIPDRVVGSLLRRAARAGRVRLQDDEHYMIDPSAEATLQDLQAEMARFEAQQDALRERFVRFVSDRFPDRVGLVEREPDRHLRDFIEKNAAPLLRRAERGRPGELGWADLTGADYLVGAFILELDRSDPTAFGYVIEAVKGAILLGVLELNEGGSRRKSSDLVLVLDTPVLLKAFGYHGERAELAVRQTLSLARAAGIATVCFEHTVKELDGVLESVIPILRQRGRTRENLRAVDTHFLDSGQSPADIALLQESLVADLGTLEIEVIENPGGYYRHGLDEDALDSTLKQYLPTQRETTRAYDVQSLSAIHRLRRGKAPATFEACRYVLVTDNVGICIASRHVEEASGWSLAMLDRDVAALLWIRSPATAGDLPRDHLLATVYAGMRPGAHLWIRYVEEIERLELAGTVDANEALVLQTRPEARSILMETTLGESAELTGESVELVLGRLKADLEAPLRESLDRAENERASAVEEASSIRAAAEEQSTETARKVEMLQGRLAELELQIARQDQRIHDWSERRARKLLRRVLFAVALLLACLAGVNVLLPAGVLGSPGWLGALSALGAVVFGLFATLPGVFGGSVLEWLSPLERRLTEALERRERGRAGLPEVPSG
ncbi:MAG: hypothetical protein KQH57_20845 [Actinomycetales bacterium]|nr:hypothetical protein [Actinomycetales bacterium]